MIYRKSLYLFVLILLAACAFVIYSFVAQKNTVDDYKGTLVYEYNQDMVV